MTEWDSDALGGLPVAIFITMVVSDPNDQNPTPLVLGDLSNNDTVYRMVVHLPMAEPLTDEGSEVDEFLGMEQTVP